MSKAGEAAGQANAVTVQLLLAAARTGTADERRDALGRAFAAWPRLCRLMSELEQLAPTQAAAGQARDAELRAIREDRVASRTAPA